MSIKVYVNTSNKRAETAALLDSGATENFITTHYANWLRLPIKQLPRARKVCNVDGTSNKQGDIIHFTDLEVQTGAKRVKMLFFPYRLRRTESHPRISLVRRYATTQPQTCYQDHQESTKEKTITQTSRSYQNLYSSD